MKVKAVVIGVLFIAFIFMISYNKSNKIKEKLRERDIESNIQNQKTNIQMKLIYKNWNKN